MSVVCVCVRQADSRVLWWGGQGRVVELEGDVSKSREALSRCINEIEEVSKHPVPGPCVPGLETPCVPFKGKCSAFIVCGVSTALGVCAAGGRGLVQQRPGHQGGTPPQPRVFPHRHLFSSHTAPPLVPRVLQLEGSVTSLREEGSWLRESLSMVTEERDALRTSTLTLQTQVRPHDRPKSPIVGFESAWPGATWQMEELMGQQEEALAEGRHMHAQLQQAQHALT